MAWPGYFAFGGTEIINASRTEAYARHANVGWFKPVYREDNLAWLLGDSRYTSALQDDAPWADPDNLDSYDFFGVYPLSVTGIEDSTVSATVTESVIDGGYIGKTRRATRPVVFSAVLAGLSECSVEYGLRWLRTVLSGNPCFGSAYGNCGGADLCYLSCAPPIQEMEQTFNPGPWEPDRTNLSANPGAEVDAGGWTSSDATKYPITASTTSPIKGSRSILSTRQAATLDATNLALNPSLETNATGWNTNSVAAYPTTLDTTSAMSGVNSLRADRTSTSLSTSAASIQLATAGVTSAGFPCTPGTQITTSLDVKCSQANRRVSMSYQWLDASNAVLSSSTPTNKVSDTGAALSVVRAVNTDTPPANAVTCRPIVTVATLGGNAVVGEQIWFDRLRVSAGTESSYFDGSTPATGTNTYAWTGTANNSTSTRKKVGDSTAVALALTPSASTPSFTFAPDGKPLTFAVDVKVEQANRNITGYFVWLGGYGNSAQTTVTAAAAGAVKRLVVTATPPAGATACTLVVNVTAKTGVPLVGERVWFDNLVVETGATDGSYFDGDSTWTQTNTYRWTGSAHGSTSERLAETWVGEPLPTAEDCYARVGRSLHEVTTTVGPSITAKTELADGGVAWTVTWTVVAANPAEFGAEQPLIVGFLDPEVDIPYVGGEVPPGGSFDEDGYVQTEAKCPTPGFAPLYDPTCKLLVPPPQVPSVSTMCFSFPVNYRRRSFTIPRDNIPLWGQVVPILQFTTKASEVRNVRVRFYADVFNTGSPNDDPCNYCGDMVVSYIPPGSTLVLDGTDRTAYIDQPGQGRRRADTLVSDSTGAPFEWPEFSCGFGYVVTVDTPQQTKILPIVDLTLVPRAA